MKVVVSARDHLAKVKAADQGRDGPGGCASARPLRRVRRWSTCASATSTSRASSPAPSTSRAATSSRGSRRSVPDRATPVIIYCASGVRSAYAAKTLAELGYTDVVSLAGGLLRLEAERLRLEAAAHPHARAVRALQPPRAHPRGGRAGPAQAARLQGAPDRRGRARLAGRPLPGRGRGRHARHHRRRRGRRSATCSARSCTPSTASARPRSTRPRRRSARSTRT